ncbi:alpha/beta hydrolase [Streptomyces sp. SL13]|uniref:Alpha/beta hydrolase n=1 Tax=Streptantibioticus silvisoli TaxID=2705255 RepID=A0AA90KC10_9ACTN|nr:alpha/beta hydrolase [Streptantibioticus silvisoli]MDI5967459.1 alpha/beta hydrolase [Streptantibioticus silvisoli]MDI5974383.1 alpha/beta hydrolase [Streptantibioticus silvisoli]
MVGSAVAADGVRIAYETAGEGGVPLLLVHGWCCERSYLAPQFEHFAAGRQVVAVDLRGHGGSGAGEPEAYGVEVFAGDALAAAAAAGAERPVVVGHSMGALVALACAARPGAVRGAVLLDPAPVVSERGKAVFAAAVADVAADRDGAWRRRFAEGLFGPADTVRRDRVPGEMASVPVRIAAPGMRAMAGFEGAAALAAVEAAGVPVLVVTGGRPERALADWRHAVLARTAGAGHFLQLEVPEQVNAMIERFLVVGGMAS